MMSNQQACVHMAQTPDSDCVANIFSETSVDIMPVKYTADLGWPSDLSVRRFIHHSIPAL
jgi:hypothetical protein